MELETKVIAYCAEVTEHEYDGWASVRPSGYILAPTKELLEIKKKYLESKGSHDFYWRVSDKVSVISPTEKAIEGFSKHDSILIGRNSLEDFCGVL